MFVQMAESDIFKFTVAARNQEYLLRLFIKKKNRNMDLYLICLKPKCPSELCQFDKNKEEE